MRNTGIVFCVAILLVGCGGGGSSNVKPAEMDMERMSPEMQEMQAAMPTPIVDVDVASAGKRYETIHLEMTDAVIVVNTGEHRGTRRSAYFPDTVVIQTTQRAEVVCPGVPPRGNECQTRNIIIDGGERRPVGNIGQIDYSVNYHTEFIDLLDASFSMLQKTLNDVELFTTGNNAQAPGESIRITATVGALDHAAFYFGAIDDRAYTASWAAALGELHSDYPPRAGSSIWKGAMVGYQRSPTTSPRGAGRLNWPTRVEGEATLSYDFSVNEVDLSLTEIEAPDIYGGPESLKWNDLTVNADGSFYLSGTGNHRAGTDPHPTQGYVDGDFYGPNGKEFAGVFESAPYTLDGLDGWALIGAFGGRREE